MLTGILKNFPENFTPSSQQVKILKEIETAFDEGHKFIVCNAPTGSGKSFISKTIGNASAPPSDDFKELIFSYAAYKQVHGGGYANADECLEEQPFGAIALTITKALQDQYKRLFNDIEILKGKSNYQCAIDDRYSVDLAPCIHLKSLKEDCWTKNKCPYYNARNTALASQFATLNYTMFFSLPEHLKSREYIICDEASELEEQLVKHFSCTINFSLLKKYQIDILPFSSDHSKVERWISNMSLRIHDRIEELKADIQSKKKGSENERKAELLFLINLYSKLSLILETWMASEYLYETDVKGITFKPLKVDKLAQNLFDHGKRIILLSATIIDHANFCKTLGINRYKYIEVESSFDAKNAPIYVNTKVKLSHGNLKQNLPKIKKQIEEICNLHKDEKGLIHTHTNTITSYLQSTMYSKRYLYREPGVSNENILNDHLLSPNPTVLISPSMSYGVDLKDDLARFQIIIKAPYLPLNDKRVEKMMKIDKDWYINKMLSSLVQSCGRGVRSPSDHCVTYILDGAIVESVISNRQKLPKYFINRFV